MTLRDMLSSFAICAAIGLPVRAEEPLDPAATTPAAIPGTGALIEYIDLESVSGATGVIGILREESGDYGSIEIGGLGRRNYGGETPGIEQQLRQAQDALRALQATYQSVGMLDAAQAVEDQIASLEQLRALPMPTITRTPDGLDQSPRDFRGQTGTTVYLRTAGRDHGSVWGSGPYTDDSDLGAAAVHAGILTPGEEAIVAVQILEGQDGYSAGEANGVRTSEWGSFSGSFQVLSKGLQLSDATSLRGKNESINVYVTGNTDGTVWGSDVFTDDSDIGAAAVHAGLLEPGQSGFVRLTSVPGLQQYSGGNRHGVTTRDYRAWGGSFVLTSTEAVQPQPMIETFFRLTR